MKKLHKRSSEILLKIVHDKPSNHTLTYQDFVHMLGGRAFGVAILLFSLPAILPFSVIPGIAFVFSIPILIFAVQMISRRGSLWLPKIIAHHTISHEKISKVIKAALPYIIKLERFLKPRWSFMATGIMEVINGIAIFLLAILLILPIPLSNFIFGGCIILFSLGTTEKDGVFIIMGYIFFLLYLSFIFLLTLAVITLY